MMCSIRIGAARYVQPAVRECQPRQCLTEVIATMKLSTRLTLAMVALVSLTTTTVALFNYRDLEATILPHALERLEAHASLRAIELESHIRGAAADVLSLRSTSTVAAIIRAHRAGGTDPFDGTNEDVLRARVAKNFVGQLETKSPYLQFRIIGIDDGGREIVRVDRSTVDGTIRIVPDDELQRKGDRDYFQAAVKAPAGEVYFSQIDLNQEGGVIETPHVPVLRVAASLQQADGQPFGILI